MSRLLSPLLLPEFVAKLSVVRCLFDCDKFAELYFGRSWIPFPGLALKPYLPNFSKVEKMITVKVFGLSSWGQEAIKNVGGVPPFAAVAAISEGCKVTSCKTTLRWWETCRVVFWQIMFFGLVWFQSLQIFLGDNFRKNETNAVKVFGSPLQARAAIEKVEDVPPPVAVALYPSSLQSCHTCMVPFRLWQVFRACWQMRGFFCPVYLQSLQVFSKDDSSQFEKTLAVDVFAFCSQGRTASEKVEDVPLFAAHQ